MKTAESEGDDLDKVEKEYLQFVELLTTMSTPHGEPRTYNEASESSDKDQWRATMQEEVNSLVEMQVWERVPRPKDQNVVGCKWVYRLKFNAQGEVVRYKARLVAKGYSQVDGLDYNETFAPVTRLETIRLLFALAVKKDWEIRQIDVKTTYLYGDLDKEIFMEIPEGLPNPKGEVFRLKKALYGLKQAGRQWYLKLKSVLSTFGLKQVASEPHTFVAHKVVDNVKCTLILPIYVDDLFPIGDTVLVDEFQSWIGESFNVTIIGDVSYFLGI